MSLVLLPHAECGGSLVGLHVHGVDWPLDSRDKMQHQQRRCRATANLHRWQMSSIEAIPMRAGLAGQQPPPRPRPASAPLGVAALPALSTRGHDTAWSGVTWAGADCRRSVATGAAGHLLWPYLVHLLRRRLRQTRGFGFAVVPLQSAASADDFSATYQYQPALAIGARSTPLAVHHLVPCPAAGTSFRWFRYFNY